MNTFGNTLGEYLELLGITQIGAAELIGCSRSMIYAILNDERKLSEAKFQNMLSAIPFSPAQADALRALYYEDKYPQGVMQKVFRIKNYLRRPRTDAPAPALPRAVRLPGQDTAISGEREIQEMIAAMLTDKECTEAITNFSYQARTINNTFFATLAHRTAPINFQHIIRFEKDNHSTLNIENIFESVRYLKLRHNPLYYYTETVPITIRGLYPQFLVTPTAVLLFHEKANFGIFLKTPAIVSEVAHSVRQFLPNYQPLAQITDNILALKEYLTDTAESNIIYSFSNFACFLPHAPREYFDEIANPDLPNREAMINIGYQHYVHLAPHYVEEFMTVRGIKRFTKDGMAANFPQSWLVSASYETRIQVLKDFRQRVCDGSLLLLNDDVVSVSDDFWSIDIGERYLCVFGSISQDENRFSGEYAIATKNRNIIADFRFYFDYIKRNRLYCTKEFAVNFLDAQILECERLKNQESP